VIRVLRLARLFKLLRTSKSSVDLFAETMVKSFKALNMLLLLITIGVVVFSSLMYFIERGRWNGVGGYWEQVYSYNCPVTVTSTSRGEPNSFLEITKPLLRGNSALNDTQNVLTYSAGENKPCALQSVSPDATTATFLCEYPYKRSESCVSMYRQSQYDSIARAFWWTFVTMTTVGYGYVCQAFPNPDTVCRLSRVITKDTLRKTDTFLLQSQRPASRFRAREGTYFFTQIYPNPGTLFAHTRLTLPFIGIRFSRGS
jgi:hypothetical protein